MNLNRIYNNPGLEARRLALLKRLQAEKVLRDSHEGSGSIVRQIELGFHSPNKQKKTRLAQWIGECAQTLSAQDRDAFKLLLLAMEEQRASLLHERKHIGAMARLARFSSRWLRTPAGFSAHSYNAGRQFGELARFLLARWPVPKFFDSAWSEQSTDAHREWFIHIGAGGNLRTAPGLPFPLTKMMAHHALLAPDDVSILPALRWGQVRALGGSERQGRAIIATLLSDAQADEPFWVSAIQFFVANPMLDPHQIGPIVDWIHHQRFVGEPQRIVNGVACGGDIPQPNLTMKGRSVDSILRQVERWHGELNRATFKHALIWPPCGVPGYERIEGTEGSQTIVRIDEILTSAELQHEGQAMRHCVASYARTCARGAAAIFSLKLDRGAGSERRLTIEVDVRSKRIRQARGRCNAPPQPLDERYMRNWATAAGLTIGGY
ncbi:MAG TPA: PcfJ domain-containing protein [Humisphaera sp.]|jgi:hypothetical protein|nr:PcfJ domain-containing protein [Humisphaera sp.]